MGLVTRRYRLLSLVVVFAVSLLIAPSLFASSGEAQEQQSNEKKQPLNSLMQKRSANDADSNTAGQQLPQLFYPEETHDFGAVERGSKLVHLFKVQNTGDAPLRIFNAKGS